MITINSKNCHGFHLVHQGYLVPGFAFSYSTDYWVSMCQCVLQDDYEQTATHLHFVVIYNFRALYMFLAWSLNLLFSGLLFCLMVDFCTSALIRPYSTNKWLLVRRWASHQSDIPSLKISFRPFYKNANSNFLTTKPQNSRQQSDGSKTLNLEWGGGNGEWR